MTDLASAIAAAGGIPSAFSKDDPVGTSITGRIESAELRQVTSFETQEPETWADGSPKQQVVITLTTDLQDGPDDDGRRRVYVKWWGDQKKALVAAIKNSGDNDLHPGGTFTATFSGLGEVKTRGFNAPKLYTYQYVKPPTGLAQAVAAAPAATAPAQQQAGEPWGPPAAAPDAGIQAKVAQMRTLGLADSAIAAALGVDPSAVAETPF
jgi:hypothetical protein